MDRFKEGLDRNFQFTIEGIVMWLIHSAGCSGLPHQATSTESQDT